jgi:hypothetical protein
MPLMHGVYMICMETYPNGVVILLIGILIIQEWINQVHTLSEFIEEATGKVKSKNANAQLETISTHPAIS